ncbi:MAG: hypothetical protein U5Q16_09045 [Gammaproteobacteria bacterium]|nr:hypothetical protein [Gammaproteobacteria bacterium]
MNRCQRVSHPVDVLVFLPAGNRGAAIDAGHDQERVGQNLTARIHVQRLRHWHTAAMQCREKLEFKLGRVARVPGPVHAQDQAGGAAVSQFQVEAVHIGRHAARKTGHGREFRLGIQARDYARYAGAETFSSHLPAREECAA